MKNKLYETTREYLYTIYQIESLREMNIRNMYGLEQNRILLHSQICEILNIEKESTYPICFHLDTQINFAVKEIEKNYNILDTYTDKLIIILSSLPKKNQ